MKTLEYKFSLFILVLPDPVLRFQFVVLHRFRIVQVDVLRVEHMSTQIEHSPFVDLGCFVLCCVYLGIVFDEVADPFDEFTVLFLGFEELLFRQV